jgi:membrane-bound metal-dependent hydrolase YbcI (DUF457 family)
MNTPTHAALNFLVLGRQPGTRRAWIFLGAVLPDLPMFGFYLFETLFHGEPAARIFGELYFQPGWQALFNVFHSIPLFLLIAFWSWWRRSAAGQAFATSLLLHSLVDWPTHLEDAHAYLWPLWRQPLPGVISYWHPGSPLWVAELAIIAAAVGWVAWERSSEPEPARQRAIEVAKNV